MDPLNIFYQREGEHTIEHIEVEATITFAVLKERIRDRHGLETDIVIFIEDIEEPCGDEVLVVTCVTHAGGKVHVHRCRHIHVHVTYNGDTVEHRFAPSATIAHVKHWAAVKKFGMSPEDAGEHMLQIKGTTERPSAGTHIGTLSKCPHCRVDFDLVPDERVHGASGVH